MNKAVLWVSLCSLAISSSCNLGDASSANEVGWTQFRGPNSNGISNETGLATSWPESGPEELWRVPIGAGFSGIVVSKSRGYTMDSQGEEEFLLCFNTKSGQEIWRTSVGPIFKNSFGDGPRSTPAIDQDVVYALGSEGRLVAANAESGEAIWSVELKETFSFRPPEYWWGFSVSPYIVEDLILLNVGGEGNKSLAALNKKTGETIWTAHEDVAAYSTPTALEFNGRKQFVFVTGTNVVSVSPEGDVLWKYPWGGSFIKVAMPTHIPPDKIFVSASYGIGAVLLRMKEEGPNTGIEEVWTSKVMNNHFHSSVLLGEHLYGFDNGTLKCIEAETGTETWGKRRLGKGSLIYADGQLIVLSEKGKLVLAEAKPDAYVEKANAQILQGRTWTQPTLADGKLFVRHQSEMVCLNLRNTDS